MRPSPSSCTVGTCTLLAGIRSTNSTAVPTEKPVYWRQQAQCTCATVAPSCTQASRAASIAVSTAATCRTAAGEAHFSFHTPGKTCWTCCGTFMAISASRGASRRVRACPWAILAGTAAGKNAAGAACSAQSRSATRRQLPRRAHIAS
ncbi:uncharacterized protein LOC142776420 isoform X2 [Rhipicephalus microplus]|uniref:uncharacterized protein LOC142776420 isoform X2 n=1 Tax=Rhipicephalus microplus TaxID=6941 RepID=UPI003F6AE9F0